MLKVFNYISSLQSNPISFYLFKFLFCTLEPLPGQLYFRLGPELCGARVALAVIRKLNLQALLYRTAPLIIAIRAANRTLAIAFSISYRDSPIDNCLAVWLTCSCRTRTRLRPRKDTWNYWNCFPISLGALPPPLPLTPPAMRLCIGPLCTSAALVCDYRPGIFSFWVIWRICGFWLLIFKWHVECENSKAQLEGICECLLCLLVSCLVSCLLPLPHTGLGLSF